MRCTTIDGSTLLLHLGNMSDADGISCCELLLYEQGCRVVRLAFRLLTLRYNNNEYTRNHNDLKIPFESSYPFWYNE